MRNIQTALTALLLLLISASRATATDLNELQIRRQNAAQLVKDGLLLVHARTSVGSDSDSYRESAGFYYLTGLEDFPRAILVIDGKSGDAWLFIHKSQYEETARLHAVDSTARKSGIEHVLDWDALQDFLAKRISVGTKIYYEQGEAELPASFSKGKPVPAWVQVLQNTWPKADFQPIGDWLSSFMAVESPAEQEASGVAARATVAAFLAGMKAIRPGLRQRAVELVVANTCWSSGAHGVSFWPWVMAGPNGIFPKPMESLSRYDYLDARMLAGDLVRLDVGCEWAHYQGDLGRTVPVSGRYTEEQREIWNMFVAAYRAGAAQLRDSPTEEQVFAAWKNELLRHRNLAKTSLARQAIDSWSERKNVPYWQIHTMNLEAGSIGGSLRAGMVVDFESIVSIGGQGYYMEDMFLITQKGAEVLTPGMPYSAEEIEAVMAGGP